MQLPVTESAAPASGRPQYRLSVTAYDRTSSLLIALLILVGVIVLGLLIVYWTLGMVDTSPTVPISMAEASRPPSAAMGLARDIEPPGLEEAPELTDPQLPETLSVIADAVSSREALLADQARRAQEEIGRGTGVGDSRQSGIGGEGVIERVPRWERWQILYLSPDSIDEYARQLDFFGIEIAGLGTDNRVHYAYNLSKTNPDTRVAPPTQEKRIRFAWRSGRLQAADRELLRRAGIQVEIRAVIQFIPPQLETQLLALEKQHGGRRSVNEIRRTVFQVERAGGGFTFRVVAQDYF